MADISRTVELHDLSATIEKTGNDRRLHFNFEALLTKIAFMAPL